MNKYFFNILLLFVFLITPAARADGPARWTLSDEDTTVHITGTIHLVKPGLNWMDTDTKKLIEGADALILELDESQMSPGIMQPLALKYGMLPADQSLKTVLGDVLFGEFVAAFGGAIPAQALDRMQPWMASVTLITITYMQAGYDPNAGADKSYMALAKAAGVAIQGLEKAEDQLKALATLADSDAKAFVRMTLDQKEEALTSIDAMTTAWLDGDDAALADILNKGFKDHAGLAESLLFARNRNWAEQVNDLMKRPGTFVIAVGAGHLVGEQNLVLLLRQQGWRVARQ